MARLRRGAPLAVRRGPRRAVDWEISFSSVGVTNVPAGTKVLLGSITAATLNPIAPATVIRTRGVVAIGSDQAAANEVQTGAVGLAFVNDVARALGVTGLPGPITDFGYTGWFWYQSMAEEMRFGTAVGLHPNWLRRYEIDSRAMRKFEGSSGLVLMAENAGSAAFDLVTQIRILIKAG